jgi:pSer/pThr/pTyr-binding forkhead associated (FHA) protein
VNGQAVVPQNEVLLRDGDMIQIGAHRILFREKATASRLAKPNADDTMKPSRPGAVPIPSHLCSFCGAPKDANGNCRCSLGAPGAPAMTPGMMPAMSQAGSYVDPYAAPAPAYGAASMMPDYAVANPSAPPIGQLVGIEGPYAGQVFSLNGMNIEVGRETDKDIVLSSDTTISRGHARLTQDQGNVIVTDLGSSNGTYVNGQRLYAPMPIVPGDVVQFGSSKFTYQ